MKERTKKTLGKAFWGAILLLTILGGLKSIWISLDIDESYAVALGYRLAIGDRLLRDMWEPHQFSGFLAALLIRPYLGIRGNAEYLVIYLRVAGICIHTGLGICLYRLLRRFCSRWTALLILYLHLNFLPKWVQMPEFELMHYWFLLGIFLLLVPYFTGKRRCWFLAFGAGGCLVGGILCYPTMILLYPFYALGIYALSGIYIPIRK